MKKTVIKVLAGVVILAAVVGCVTFCKGRSQLIGVRLYDLVRDTDSHPCVTMGGSELDFSRIVVSMPVQGCEGYGPVRGAK